MKNSLIALFGSLIFSSTLSGGERDDKVNGDRSAFEDSDIWIYNDLEKGFRVSTETGKPLLVVYRCIP